MIKFETGKTYKSRSIGDHNCIFSHEILKRTAKTVTISDHGDIVRRKIMIRDGEEEIGRYSMAPILKASRQIV